MRRLSNARITYERKRTADRSIGYVQTEQVARDNKVREPVNPTVALTKSNAERQVKADDKRRKQSSGIQPSIPAMKPVKKMT